MAGPEKLFENKIKIYLSKINAFYIKYWGGSQFTIAGIPDILCCVNGRFVAIEVKAARGIPSELQLYKIGELQNSGAFAFVVYPSAWATLKTLLDELVNGKYNTVNDLQDYFHDENNNLKKILK